MQNGGSGGSVEWEKATETERQMQRKVLLICRSKRKRESEGRVYCDAIVMWCSSNPKFKFHRVFLKQTCAYGFNLLNEAVPAGDSLNSLNRNTSQESLCRD